ncbi:MAG: DUF3108 domain-containing protein [Proteobacteria bacterium]|nr:DUF3108 domain-containing protein [Pseudomonadota bacterium]
MNRLLNTAIFLCLITSSFPAGFGIAGTKVNFSGSSYAQNVVEFSADYQASANGIAATATRTLQHLSGESYRLSNSLEASLAGQVIARLDQVSEFQVAAEPGDQHIIPISYSYLLSGVSSAVSTVNYNWDTGIAISREDDERWSITLTDGVLDQLSYQFALRQRIAAGERGYLEFQLIDEDEIELHRYHVVGEELLSTPLGLLNTTRLDRIREEDDDRRTVIWLANDWHYLLAKIEQRSGSGLRIELELESATVDGDAVIALSP